MYIADDSDVFRTKKRDDDTSDEEQAWLDALEKGELDDNGEVKKTKDESLLTARQVTGGGSRPAALDNGVVFAFYTHEHPLFIRKLLSICPRRLMNIFELFLHICIRH